MTVALQCPPGTLAPACTALAIPRASVYRHRRATPATKPRPTPARVDADAMPAPSARGGRWFKYVCPFCGLIARARHGATLICGAGLNAMEPAD